MLGASVHSTGVSLLVLRAVLLGGRPEVGSASLEATNPINPDQQSKAAAGPEKGN